jgi:hypothetical protein
MKPATPAAERQLEKALETIRGIKSICCALAEIHNEDDGEIFGFLGLQLAVAHEQAVHAYGRIFFGADKEAAE